MWKGLFVAVGRSCVANVACTMGACNTINAVQTTVASVQSVSFLSLSSAVLDTDVKYILTVCKLYIFTSLSSHIAVLANCVALACHHILQFYLIVPLLICTKA